MRGKIPKVCLLSSIPVTLWSFYRRLPVTLKDAGFEPEICSSPGRELEYFREQYGIKVHAVNILRQISPMRDISAILKLVWLFKRNCYDIVHAHTPKAGFVGMIAAAAAGVKCRIYTCHGLPLESDSGIKRGLLALAEKTSCAFAHQVLAVSHSLSENLRLLGLCRSSKIKILGDGSACGIDLSRFTLSEDLIQKAKDVRGCHNIPEDAVVIGFIGRLVPDKGIHLLIESFAELYQTNQNIRLLVIGDFELHRGRLSDMTTEMLKNHPGIIRIGFTEQIEKYYAAIDLLVLPTRREGFPYTLLESAAMSLPVIATRVTGCVDAVVDGQTGLLIPPEDFTALTNAMKTLVCSPQLRRQMGQMARKRVEQKFTSQRLLQAHMVLYRELLK